MINNRAHRHSITWRDLCGTGNDEAYVARVRGRGELASCVINVRPRATLSKLCNRIAIFGIFSSPVSRLAGGNGDSEAQSR